MTRETAIGLLLSLMDEESHVRASHWGANHEYILWAHVVDEASESERFFAFDTARLRELANVANGWFVWKDEPADVEFVELDRWLEMYAQQRAELGGKARK